jgi:hypothetical protein
VNGAGHCPGVLGIMQRRYGAAGIFTVHPRSSQTDEETPQRWPSSAVAGGSGSAAFGLQLPLSAFTSRSSFTLVEVVKFGWPRSVQPFVLTVFVLVLQLPSPQSIVPVQDGGTA